MPIIVDVPNISCLHKLIGHYNVGEYYIKNALEFAKSDCLPMLDAMKHFLSSSKDVIFLNGLTFYLQLQGNNVLVREIKSMLELQTQGKLILITFACGKILETFDYRLFEASRILEIDGICDELPTLNFISPKLSTPSRYIGGIHMLQNAMELMAGKDIFIVTKRSKLDFLESEYNIREYNTSFQVISERYRELDIIGKEAGIDANWDTLLTDIEGFESWLEYVSEEFGSTDKLSFNIRNFEKLSEFEKWAYFLALRTYGANENDYLSGVIMKSPTFNSFIECCFVHILSYNVQDKNFRKVYRERKIVLEGMQVYNNEISKFCHQVYSKEAEALYYMTDLNMQEKEVTIDLLARYGNKYEKKSIVSILNNTYRDLALYLSPFYSGNKELDNYIESYKYCKVTNKISDEFRKMVDFQAIQRQYITWLPPRASKIDSILKCIDKDKTELYFIDAMGIEYLGFLQNKCMENKLIFHANIARCDLPSITSVNKGFCNEFRSAGSKVYSIPNLDSLKHEGNSSYNYENTKIPIHIVEELNILNRLVNQLKTIELGRMSYIISDHGATRLAVINEKETKWEISEKGKHSGRCCPISDIDGKPDFAIEENGFWCIANYDRFKGGRKALVEVHGGATIEEVAVPIIAVEKQDKSIMCRLKENKPIFVSYKRDAQLTLFVDVESDEIKISINGTPYLYNATKTGILYHYEVSMPDIKKSGIYHFNVYLKNVLICRNLTFELKKESASERKLF